MKALHAIRKNNVAWSGVLGGCIKGGWVIDCSWEELGGTGESDELNEGT